MDKKIPFGKFKGKAYRFLLEPYNKDYAIWLLNDCQKTLAFHPEFYEFLKEEFVDDYVKKSTAFSERQPSKFIEMNGVLIETFHTLSKYPNFLSLKLFINKDGNFTIRSNEFQYVANFNGQLYIPSKETLEKLGTK